MEPNLKDSEMVRQYLWMKEDGKISRETYEVLVEEQDKKNPEIIIGRTTQNRVMHFKGDVSLIGKIVPVKTNHAYPQNLRGDLVALQ